MDEARFASMPSGYAGTGLTIARMGAYAAAGLRDERVHQLARSILIDAGVDPSNGPAVARALLGHFSGYLKTLLPFSAQGFQRVQSVGYTLFDAPTRAGECASLTAAYCALSMAAGLPTAFRTGGPDASKPRAMEHVWSIVAPPAGCAWIDVDPLYMLFGEQYPGTQTTIDWGIAT